MESFKTNHLTDKFKRTFINVANVDEFKRAQELMFKMGFQWISGGRTVRDGYNTRYVYVDKDNRMMQSTEFCNTGRVMDFREITMFDLSQAADEVKAIRKARKKDSKRRKKDTRMLTEGWIKNTGTKPEGKVGSVVLRCGEVRGRGAAGIDPAHDYSIPFGFNPDMTVEYYKLAEQPKTVSVQEMVKGIVEDAGGKEVVTTDEDGFILWSGGECPVDKDTFVEIKFRDSHKVYPVNGAGVMRWYHFGSPGDIVAYRVCHVVAKQPDVFVEVPEVEPDTNPKRQYGLSAIPLNLWSPLASAYGAVSLYNGSLKYGRGNYRATKVEASIYIAAALRHLMAWAEGEEFDPADGCPNLGGVLANIAILLDARASGTLIDDRQIPSGYLKEREMLKEIVKQLQVVHAGKDPRHYTIADAK